MENVKNDFYDEVIKQIEILSVGDILTNDWLDIVNNVLDDDITDDGVHDFGNCNCYEIETVLVKEYNGKSDWKIIKINFYIEEEAEGRDEYYDHPIGDYVPGGIVKL